MSTSFGETGEGVVNLEVCEIVFSGEGEEYFLGWWWVVGIFSRVVVLCATFLAAVGLVGEDVKGGGRILVTLWTSTVWGAGLGGGGVVRFL